MKAITEFFQVGGTLSEDAPSYIERPADQELLAALMEQELCLVLAPRQMGKSSLMVHAISRLKQNGKRPGIVDLELLGNQTDPEIWFGDVIHQISRSLSLNIDAVAWWGKYHRIGPTQRFITFIEDIILTQVSDDVVIFIDEIDSILKLPFSDDFFTSIRAVYNARAANPELRRITFVLLGVATASSFIQDRTRTPFNIGKSITLHDFENKLTLPFKQVLGPDSEKIIDRIFYWTNGQPYLVQQLSAVAFSWLQDERSATRIDEEIRKTYLECKIEHDVHLKPIQDYLLAEPRHTQKIINIYRKVLMGKEIREDERSPIQNRLKLSGVVRAENSKLAVRNRIYENIFNSQWLSNHTSALSRKLFILSSQLPLYIGLWQLWTRVIEQPILAVLICALYELLVLAIIFSSEIGEMRENETLKIIFERVPAIFKNLVSRFRRRYKKQIITKHGVFNIRGLGLINVFSLLLDQVFVDLRIVLGNPQKFNTDLIARTKVPDRKSIWDFLRLGKGGSESKVLAIIGPPGCGKTTLLQHVATTLAANRHRRYSIQSYTPVLLFLREHIKTICQDEPPALGKLLQDYFSNTDLFPMLRPPKGWFERELERGKCIILLDGLDEVAEIQQRKAVSAWVDDQINNYSSCSFLLTSRPQGYRYAPLQRADVLEVQPFNPKQVQKFIENWYLANEIKTSGEQNDASVRSRAIKDASDLLQRLQAAPQLGALTVNPLLLTMIAMVHRYHGALPGSRAELYAEICEVLLGRWRQSKGIKDELNPTQKIMILQLLASYMMEKKLRNISIEEASLVVEQSSSQMFPEFKVAQNFLYDLQANSGLLLELEVGHWSFAHLTFQEYLTASYWAKQKTNRRNWNELVSDIWWHETLRLYAAQSDASPIIQACLNNNDLLSLILAADCLEDTSEVDFELRRSTEERVIDALESSDTAMRNFAAEVQLSRRLNSLQRIDENREIDLVYLTCAEYQLFLDDKQSQGEYYQPDHWPHFIFSKGEALSPITGIRAEDAMSFCSWLTQRQGSGVYYRIPESHEALQYPAQTANLGAWSRDERNKFILVGLAEANKQTVLQYLSVLSKLPLPPLEELRSTYDNRSPRDIARDLINSLDRASSLAANVENDRERGLHIARDLTYAVNLGISLLFHLALDLNLSDDLNFSHERARDIGLALMGEFDLPRERVRTLDLMGKLDRVVTFDSAYSRIFNIKVGFRRKRIFQTQLKRAIELDLTLEIARGIARDLADILNLISNIRRDITHTLVLVAREDFAELHRQFQGELHTSDSVLGHLMKLLNDRGILANPDIGYSVNDDASLLKRIRNRINYVGEVEPTLLKLYWWLQIVIAREKGKIPAWEGIRIVQEKPA